MRKLSINSFVCLLTMLLFLGANSLAYSSENSEKKWLSPRTTFYTGDLIGFDDNWKDAFEEAAARWNDTATQFWIRTVRDIGGPGFCTSDGRNSAQFSASLCGDEWGENTLAVASSYFSGDFLFKVDIAFNSNRTWDIYDGIRRSSAIDFRRVAVHELGHAIGLNHLSDTDAIMAPLINDSYVPQYDDVIALLNKYGNSFHTLTLNNNGNGKIEVEPRVLGTGVINVDTNILMRSNYEFLDCAAATCDFTIQDGLRLVIRAFADDEFVSWTETALDSSGLALSPIFSDRTYTANYSTGAETPPTSLPTSPTLALIPTSAGPIGLSWGTVTGSNSYQIYRCSSIATSSCGDSIATINTASYFDARGDSGTSYYYRVSACNSIGCSPLSNAVVGLKAFSKPSTPITSELATSVIIAWANTQNSETTQLYRCTTTDTASCGAPIETTTKTVFTDSTGTAGIEYFYRIKFCNGSNCSEYSDFVSATKTALIPAPTVPAAPLINNSLIGVTLVWSNVLSATSYEIYRCSTTSISSCASKIGDSTTISFTDTAGAVGIDYYYRLKACNSNSCSEFGDSAIGAKTSPLAQPSAPISLVVSNTTAGVSISWVAAITADYYQVYTCSSETLSSCGIFPTDSTEPSINITDGAGGKEYFYRVKSCNDSGCSDFSNFVIGSKIGFSIATFSNNELTIPAVAVDTVFGRFYFAVVLKILSTSPVYEFGIVSSTAIEGFESGEYSTFTSSNNSLSIPKAKIGDAQYKFVFKLQQNEDSAVFQLANAEEI